MECTEDLVREHHAVVTALGIMEAVAARLEAGVRVEPADLAEMLEFLSVFVDLCHHTKEERHLFPAMEEAGSEDGRATARVLLAEHERARGEVRAIRDDVGAYEAGEEGAGLALAEALRAYAALLRVHIKREDGDFFPLAEERLPDETKLALVNAYAEVERDVVGPGRHEAFHEMLARQRARYE